MPLRLTVSPRSLEQNGVEVKRRNGAERLMIGVDKILSHVTSEIEALQSEIVAGVAEVAFDDF